MDVNEAIIAIYQQKQIKPTYADFARIFKIKRQSVSMMVSRGTKLSEDKIKLLEKHYKVSLANVNIDNKFKNCALIPVFENVEAGMGAGVIVHNETSLANYPIGISILKDLAANESKCHIVFGRGNSMNPTIQGGDALLVDTSRKEVYDGRIYVLRYSGQSIAKRLQKIPPNTINVISDNPQYESFKIDLSRQIDFDFEIIGEVLWWGRIAR